jgi:hypothetical protein
MMSVLDVLGDVWLPVAPGLVALGGLSLDGELGLGFSLGVVAWAKAVALTIRTASMTASALLHFLMIFLLRESRSRSSSVDAPRLRTARATDMPRSARISRLDDGRRGAAVPARPRRAPVAAA